LSSSCDADRLWPRLPIPDDLFFCSGNDPFVSSIDCSVHERDQHQLDLMITLDLNKNNSSAWFQQEIAKDENFYKQAKH
jgi:hypothetical protein